MSAPTTLAPTETTQTTETEFGPLKASDVCEMDEINKNNPYGIRAYYRFVLPSGKDLVFCKHHGDQQLEHAAAHGIRVMDETDLLLPKITSGHL